VGDEVPGAVTAGPLSGAVAGFAVRSEVPLAYLRTGGSDELSVAFGPAEPEPEPPDPPIREWEPLPENPFHAKLWRTDDRDRLWIEGVGWYEIDPAASTILVPPDADPVPREERLWGIPTSLCIIDRGDQTLHAGSVEIGETAILVGAPGRHGKTTLVTAFHGAGYRLLSEDTTRCRPGSDALAFPGPAMLRVRRDSFERLGVPDAEIVGEDPDRVHLAIDPSRRGSAGPLPIAGIVLLREADGIRLERVAPELAIPELWALAFKLPTDEDRARCFAAVGGLASSVPVWNLHRPLRYDTLEQVIDAVVSLAAG
jgi:hypothetical protein